MQMTDGLGSLLILEISLVHLSKVINERRDNVNRLYPGVANRDERDWEHTFSPD